MIWNNTSLLRYKIYGSIDFCTPKTQTLIPDTGQGFYSDSGTKPEAISVIHLLKITQILYKHFVSCSTRF